MNHHRGVSVRQKGADFSIRADTSVSGGEGITILRGKVEVLAGTARITADEAELHDSGPTVQVMGKVTVRMLGAPDPDSRC